MENGLSGQFLFLPSFHSPPINVCSSKGDLSPPPHSHYELNSDTSTQRDFQISTHISSYLAHLMHMWNWFTGARSGTHISISSSTELKFYHLFDFKAKNTQLTLLHRGRKLSKASFFSGRVGLQLPHSHPHSWTQCLVSLRAVRKSNAHVSIPLSCSSHEPPQNRRHAKEWHTDCLFSADL